MCEIREACLPRTAHIAVVAVVVVVLVVVVLVVVVLVVAVILIVSLLIVVVVVVVVVVLVVGVVIVVLVGVVVVVVSAILPPYSPSLLLRLVLYATPANNCCTASPDTPQLTCVPGAMVGVTGSISASARYCRRISRRSLMKTATGASLQSVLVPRVCARM